MWGCAVSALRSGLIRLAHARPELRPHLLPMIRTANIQYIPDDYISLGFEGADRDDEATAIGEALEAANETIRSTVMSTLRMVGHTLSNSATDFRPGLSRAAIRLSYDDMLDNCKVLIDEHVYKIPVKAARRSPSVR